MSIELLESDSDPADQSSAADATPVRIGVIGSPSSTGEVTIDLIEAASLENLLGDLVYLSHNLSGGRSLLALGTVGEIETRNRWHEDPNMRGVLRVHGSLPHLSGEGDVRTAKVYLQAVYDVDNPQPPFGENPRESGGALGMSPTTGSDVCRVDQMLVDGLVARHAAEIVYLGHVYRSEVRLPMYIRDFTGAATDGAFHTGVFGRSGSGKTALVTYMMAMQMRHLSLSMFVFDPQGQFTRQNGMVLDLQRLAKAFGRPVHALSVAEDIRLPPDAGLLAELLEASNFFNQLTIKAKQNREFARDELERIIRSRSGWYDLESDELLRHLLSDLAADTNAMGRIYASQAAQDRVLAAIQTILGDPPEFEQMGEKFRPAFSLFSSQTPSGGSRTSLRSLLHLVLDESKSPKPYVIVDLSSRSGARWLDSSETKARIMRKIASELNRGAQERWQQSNKLLNCSVVFDEAARFATANPDNDEVATLSSRLVEYARETRKTGLGWTFITQEVNALHPAIYAQLRIRAYGYGLTSGSDLNRLRDEVGRGAALDLYQSFPDPNALSEKSFPFMITGPISPLSFTAAPVFLAVFTDKQTFFSVNRHHFP